MRAGIASTFFVICLLLLGGGAATAQDVVVQQFRFDKVEEPSNISVIHKALTSDEFKAILSAAAAAYGVPPETVGGAIDRLEVARANESKTGNELRGVFRSPPGYTICEAIWHNPSLNCGNTFNASYRRGKAGGGGLDGLHWYAVVNSPAGLGAGRCWVDGIVELRFVKLEKRGRYQCKPYGYCAWLEGPGGVGRNVPCGVPEEG